MEKVTVTIDYETTFDAWTDRSVRWNGWVTPAFDRAEADKVIAAMTADTEDFGCRFRWDGDTLFMAESDGAEWYDEEQVGPDANGRYPIGAWNWTWAEA